MSLSCSRAAVVSAILIAGGSGALGAQAVGDRGPTGPSAVEQRNPRRPELERRFRQRTAEVVRRRLQLSVDQMAHLQAVDTQFDRQRGALVAQERQARQSLRAELTAGDAANQQKVASLLDQLMQVQRKRLDLVESEQRELAKFMTPIQRAKYLGLQNEIRSRMQELRDRSPGAQALRH
jgi:hypothetical protein